VLKLLLIKPSFCNSVHCDSRLLSPNSIRIQSTTPALKNYQVGRYHKFLCLYAALSGLRKYTVPIKKISLTSPLHIVLLLLTPVDQYLFRCVSNRLQKKTQPTPRNRGRVIRLTPEGLSSDFFTATEMNERSLGIAKWNK